MKAIEQLSISEAFAHMNNGGQVFRETPRDRFFYKIEDKVLMCRCNELGGWHPAVASLRNSDTLYVATEDYDVVRYGEHRGELILTPLPMPNTQIG